MRRTMLPVILALLSVITAATAAFGHASFREREVPAESEQTLVLRVPEERPDEGTVAVETLVPEGFEVVDCPSEDPWTCEVEDADEGTVLSWTRDEGGEDAELTVVVRTPTTTGDSRWPTIQTYDSGTEVAWAQGAGEDRPAPVLTVVEADAPVVEDTSDPADHGTEATPDATAGGTPDPTAPPTASPTATLAPAEPTASVSPAPATEEDDGAFPLGTIAVVVAILAAAGWAIARARQGPS